MSRRQKLIERFLSKPSDFTWDELNRLLRELGYRKQRSGKTSGSRVAFVNNETMHIIRLHKPHGKAVKKYQLELIEEALRERGLLP